MTTRPCHVCGEPTDDACNRCERPTCGEHFWDQEYLGLCEPCHEQVEEFAQQGKLVTWPYPVRKAKPEWLDPDGPEPKIGRPQL
ncbi:MAG TPA: hypothetical protein VGA69_05400 [Nitriliruptorales bacterium]